MIFLTEFKWAGVIHCNQVEADSWEEAQTFVEDHGYHERVVGVLIETHPDRGTAERMQGHE